MRFSLTLLIMVLCTYGPRTLPLLLLRKPIRNPYIRAFLDYIPYAVLAALTLPAILSSTGAIETALVGLITAVLLALRDKSLLAVGIGATIAVALSESLFGLF